MTLIYVRLNVYDLNGFVGIFNNGEDRSFHLYWFLKLYSRVVDVTKLGFIIVFSI